jgi:hypothetical protein
MFVETKREGEAPVVVAPNPIRDFLLEAAEIIEQKGHCIGSLGCEQIGYCIVGAMSVVAKVNSNSVDGLLLGEIWHAVQSTIGTRDFGVWNDSHTKEEAIAALRAAAHKSR